MERGTDRIDRFGDVVASLVRLFTANLPEVGHRFDHGQLAVDLIFQHELNITDGLVADLLLSDAKSLIDISHHSTDERNTSDADVGRFLKLYTELAVEECERLGALAGSEINEAKIILANEVTTLLHGREAAQAAEKTAKEVFEKGGVGDDLPTLTLAAAEIGEAISIVQLIVKSGLAGSGKEAKRLISEGGAKMNDDIVSNAGQMVSAADLATPIKLSAGKKRHALVQLG